MTAEQLEVVSRVLCEVLKSLEAVDDTCRSYCTNESLIVRLDAKDALSFVDACIKISKIRPSKETI